MNVAASGDYRSNDADSTRVPVLGRPQGSRLTNRPIANCTLVVTVRISELRFEKKLSSC